MPSSLRNTKNSGIFIGVLIWFLIIAMLVIGFKSAGILSLYSSFVLFLLFVVVVQTMIISHVEDGIIFIVCLSAAWFVLGFLSSTAYHWLIMAYHLFVN